MRRLQTGRPVADDGYSTHVRGAKSRRVIPEAASQASPRSLRKFGCARLSGIHCRKK